MDIALKQRLVGAIVIVALGVIFIPMLLDGPRDPIDSTVDLRIPEPPGGRMETRRLPLNPGQPGEEPQASEPRDPVPVPATRNEVPEVIVATDDREAPLRPPPPDPEPEPVGTDSSPREDPVAAAPAPSAPDPDGEWVLQLGSFSRLENAEGLVQRTRDAGYEAWRDAVTVNGATIHRVRVGAWNERDEAMAVAARIADLMSLGDGISLRRMGADAGSEPETVAPGFGWWVQAGVFSSEQNATSLQDRLRAAGFVARAERIQLGGETRFRVRVGPQLDREEAEAVRARLDREFGISGLVVSNP